MSGRMNLSLCDTCSRWTCKFPCVRSGICAAQQQPHTSPACETATFCGRSPGSNYGQLRKSVGRCSPWTSTPEWTLIFTERISCPENVRLRRVVKVVPRDEAIHQLTLRPTNLFLGLLDAFSTICLHGFVPVIIVRNAEVGQARLLMECEWVYTS